MSSDAEGKNKRRFETPLPTSRLDERERSESVLRQILEDERQERSFKIARLRRERLQARVPDLPGPGKEK